MFRRTLLVALSFAAALSIASAGMVTYQTTGVPVEHWNGQDQLLTPQFDVGLSDTDKTVYLLYVQLPVIAGKRKVIGPLVERIDFRKPFENALRAQSPEFHERVQECRFVGFVRGVSTVSGAYREKSSYKVNGLKVSARTCGSFAADA